MATWLQAGLSHRTITHWEPLTAAQPHGSRRTRRGRYTSLLLCLFLFPFPFETSISLLNLVLFSTH